MSRKPLYDDDVKEKLTIRIRGSLIDRLRKVPNYNVKLEELIEKFLDDNCK